MQVLSVPHPFAFAAIAWPVDVVPLYYRTPTRGRVLIHAPRVAVPRDKHAPADFLQDWQFLVDGWQFLHECDPPCTATYLRLAELSDGILGMAEIVDCVREHESMWMPNTGWGLVLQDARPIKFTPCHGLAGIWDCPSRVEKLIFEEAA